MKTSEPPKAIKRVNKQRESLKDESNQAITLPTSTSSFFGFSFLLLALIALQQRSHFSVVEKVKLSVVSCAIFETQIRLSLHVSLSLQLLQNLLLLHLPIRDSDGIACVLLGLCFCIFRGRLGWFRMLLNDGSGSFSSDFGIVAAPPLSLTYNATNCRYCSIVST